MDTEFVTVYRLEHKTKREGPWNPVRGNRYAESVYNMLCAIIKCDEFPSIFVDLNTPLDGVPFSFVCGCESIEILRKWFAHGSSFVTLLGLAGFVIRRFRVHHDDLIRGRSGLQVAFFPDYDDVEELPLELLSDDYSDMVQAKAA